LNNALIILVILALLALAAVAAYFNWKAQEARREAFRQLAARLGWRYDPGSDTSVDDSFGQFGCFTRGQSRSGYNTLRGTRQIAGRPFSVQMGDYTYKITTSNGKTTTTRTYRFSYAIVQVPWPGVPDLLIRREGILDKLKGAMGFDDIDFESEEFSRAFWVKCPDKKFAYDVIHPKMMEFLMAGTPAPLEIKSGCVCITDGARLWEPNEFEPRLAWTERFFALWPEHVTSALEARA
jgi:hypothetical protein